MHYSSFEVHHLMNGFMIRCGCKTIVIEGDYHALLRKLEAYYQDPKAVEAEYENKRIDAHLDPPDKKPSQIDMFESNAAESWDEEKELRER